jgi:hypothetical protein
MIMRDGIVYDCLCANCKTPLYTGKCRNDCIEKHNKEMGVKTKTNADHIRAMSDEELADFISACGCPDHARDCKNSCKDCTMEWLKQHKIPFEAIDIETAPPEVVDEVIAVNGGDDWVVPTMEYGEMWRRPLWKALQ